MKRILACIFVVFIASYCKAQLTKPKEILLAEDIFDDFSKYDYKFELLSDSTYAFTINNYEWYHERHEIYRGQYLYSHDTIYFTPHPFEYAESNKAIIKDNSIEFLNGKWPFKMTLLKTDLNNKFSFDTIRFKDYSSFTYDSNFYHCFQKNVESVDLNNHDLVNIDSLINACIQQNKDNISLKNKDYYKQLIPVTNEQDEKEVWINLLYKNLRPSGKYKLEIIEVCDGGDYYFNLKINLSKLKYYDLIINDGP